MTRPKPKGAPVKSKPRVDRLALVLLELAARPQGVHSAEVSGWKVADVSNACNRMQQFTGQLFRTKVSHKCVRYFTSQAAADAYQRTHRAAGQATLSARSPARVGGQRAWWDPKDESIQPVFTKKTKRIKCKPMPQPRFTNTHATF